MKHSLLATALLMALASCAGSGSSGNAVPDSDTPLQNSVAEASDKPGVTFAFAGDIMMGTTFPDSISNTHLPRNEGRELFEHVTRLLADADFAFANLEGTFAEPGLMSKTCEDPELCYAFRTPPTYVENLSNAGIDFVALANNHINDFGVKGVKSTIKTLEDAGIGFAGLKGRCESAVATNNSGQKVAFLAFGHSWGTLSISDYATVARLIRDVRRDADFVVVSFHGGAEGANAVHVPHDEEEAFGEKRGDVEKFAHTAIEAGADVVFGHGPHVPRAMELYKDKLIMYSLGNFVTPYRVNISGINGYAPVVVATLDGAGNFVEGKISSFRQRYGRGPTQDPDNSAVKLIKSLSEEDFPASPLNISNSGELSKR